MIGLGLSVVLLFLALVAAVIYIAPRVSEKAGAHRSDATPSPRIGDAAPILQLESHTCGLLSLSAAYRVYGLSPEEKNLRFRLGVDRAAHPFDSESTGTLHPDLFRVLAQDGFNFSLIDPAASDAAAQLAAHLDGGDVAMLLIARRENGNLHWVLADAREGDRIRIVDSLAERPYMEPAAEFLSGFVLSIVAMAPAPAARSDLAGMHAAGVAEMDAVRRRWASLRE